MQILHPESLRARRAAAFTLIELLLVLVIIAVLAAVVVPNLMKRPDQARASATKADISQYETALDAFHLDNGRYPTTEEGLEALVTAPADLQKTWNGKYMKEITTDKWGNPYVYAFPTADDPGSYELFSVGKDGIPHTEDDITRFNK